MRRRFQKPQAIPLRFKDNWNCLIYDGFAGGGQLNPYRAPIVWLGKPCDIVKRFKLVDAAVKASSAEQQMVGQILRGQAVRGASAPQRRQYVEGSPHQIVRRETFVDEGRGLDMDTADQAVDADRNRIDIRPLCLPLTKNFVDAFARRAVSHNPMTFFGA